MSDFTPRCPVCQMRHTDDFPECPEPSEEGYVTRAMLLDAFRTDCPVCLLCQSIWTKYAFVDGVCPDCGEPRERFGDDDVREASFPPIELGESGA